jgi:RNA polymerase sigma-70 factor (ECF subfamily)
LARLSNRHRAVIYRAYYLGRTTTQIAAEVGTNDGAVKAELHHALRGLRISLQTAGNRVFR